MHPPHSPHVAEADAFLASIGIPCRLKIGAKGFLPGLEIVDGTLVYDPQVPVSNLLHEAGHLATLPGEFRRMAQTDVSGVVGRMWKTLESKTLANPDSTLTRAMMQVSDPEATAWAWAAGEHLGIPPKTLICDDEYDGEGASIRQALQMRRYIGINGLTHAGFCVSHPRQEATFGRPAFPRLAMWVKKDVEEMEPGAMAIAKRRRKP